MFPPPLFLHNIDITIGAGDRVGILGANGAGKTTLLNLFQKKIAPQRGFVKVGKTVQVGVLSQRLDELAAIQDDRVTEVLARYPQYVEIDKKPTSAAKLLERLGFNKKQLYSRIKDLSGGEKRRMQLMLTLINQPNVLILDEPGNDLDIDMLSVLEDVLDTWAGTLIVVSHDRHLIERVTDNQYALIGGTLTHVPRGVDEYLELQRTYDECSIYAGSQKNKTDSRVDKPDKPDKPDNNQIRNVSTLSNSERHAYRKQISSIERRLETLEEKILVKREEMDAANQSDFETLGALQCELDDLIKLKDELEMLWLEISEKLSMS